MRENVEHMKVVTLSTGSHKQVTTEAVRKKVDLIGIKKKQREKKKKKNAETQDQTKDL